MSRSRRWLILFALVLGNLGLTLLVLLLLSPPPEAEERTLLTLFQRSIVDAQPSREGRVYDHLFALSPRNSKLQWEERDQEQWVRVVTWQSSRTVAQYYQPAQEAQTRVKAGDHLLWVTLVPQLQNFCRALARDIDPDFRLKQYLGLNPDRRYERFVELLVRPEQIFRPCPDPDPADSRCELEMNLASPPQVSGIDNYNLWFAELKRTSYQPQGAPWTRLGYTYDWRYGQWGVGASEYVLTPDAEYYVIANYSTDEYCGFAP